MLRSSLNISPECRPLIRYMEICRVRDSTKRLKQKMDKIGKGSVAAQQVRQLSADETATFDALRAKGVDESLASKATQSIRAIAGQNVTAMVGALRE